MIEEGVLRPGPGFRLNRFLGYYSLRLAPFPAVRRSVARLIAAAIDRVLPKHSASTDRACGDIPSLLQALANQGLVMAPSVSDRQVEDIREYLHDKLMLSDDGIWFSEEEVPAGARQAAYPLATIIDCPHVLELINSEQVLELARQYLGCRPTLSCVRIEWFFPGAAAPSVVQRFHRDRDDWAFMKLFVYLTDVDEDSGPHCYVEGSHMGGCRESTAWMKQPRYPAEAVIERFGSESVRRVLGPKGTAFYVDTWGIHKGVVPTLHPRLVIQAQYSILPIFKYNYRPAATRCAGRFDRYVNRLILDG